MAVNKFTIKIKEKPKFMGITFEWNEKINKTHLMVKPYIDKEEIGRKHVHLSKTYNLRPVWDSR